MCRLLAYLGPPRTLHDLLIAPEHSLVRQSYAPRHQRHGRVNADGFGVGWYDTQVRPEPARYRRDRPIWSDHSLTSMAPLVTSGAVVAAVRDATPPAAVEESGSPPFTSGRWLFAHNGAVEGFADGVSEALRQRLTPRRRAGIEGSSDSEVVFALVLDALDAGGDLGAALASAVDTVGGEAQARLNLVLSDGVHLAATVWGDTMFALDLGADPSEPAVVVASEPWDDDPAWVQIPDASIVEVDARGLRLSSLTTAEASSPGSGALGAGTPSSGALSNPVRVEVHLGPEDIATSLRHDVRQGLTSAHKWLPPKWFYDDAGSELFDQITRLAEYYPTRCETEILAARADEIAAASGADTLVELGSGTSAKTRLLLDGLVRAGSLRRVVPFDVSEATLRRAAEDLARSYPGTTVHALVGDFERHLRHLPQGGTRLVAFLGGTIGNLEPTQRAAFLSEVATGLAPGDSLLLGTDLVKSPARLVAAYDDAAGVTARFNTNVLNVINRELDADFDETSFAHVAGWNDEDERIEMRLRSLVDQAVYLAALDLKVDFVAGEELRTECSAKFNRHRVETELTSAGLRLAHWWTDQAGDFALSLAIPAQAPVSR